MKRIRLILALMLCLALTCLCATGLAASKAATAVPTLKLGTLKGTLRGGVSCEITVTPSVAGFLTARVLDASGSEVATVCENIEVHTKANTITFETSDASKEPLPAGDYTFSAIVTSQYGVSSKEASVKFKVGDPRPSIENVTVSTSKPFSLTVSFYASFSDKQAEANLALHRVSPKAVYFEDFRTVEFTTPSSATATMDLSDVTNLPSAAGYYTIKGTASEWYTGLYSEPIAVDIVVGLDGSAYLLEDAPAETLAEVDSFIEEYNAGTLNEAELAKAASSTATAGNTTAADTETTDSTADTVSGTTAATTTETQTGTAAGNATATTSGTTTATAAGNATATTSGATTATTSGNNVAYEAGQGSIGDEGLLIGVGVSDVADQADAGYWGLTADSSDEEIWAAITRTMVSVDVGESESAYIYDSTLDSRKRLGTVSGLSQGLNVVMELDSGWSLVEAFRNEDGAFVRGYIRSNKLRTVEPNQTYGLVIDKATQTLTVWKNGEPIGSCSVSTGLPTAKYLFRETPAGEFITVTRRGTTEYYSNGFCKYTIRINGTYHIAEIPTTKKNGSDFSLLEESLGEKATRGYICIAHDASTDGGINAEWIWNMTTDNKKVKVLILDDKDRTQVPVGE